MKATHKGDLILLTNKRVALKLLGVLFIKNFTRNIVSIKPFVDGGLTVQGTSNWKVGSHKWRVSEHNDCAWNLWARGGDSIEKYICSKEDQAGREISL